MHAPAGDNLTEPPAPPDMSAGLSDAWLELDAVRGGTGLLRDVPLWTFAQRDLLTLTREVERAARSLFGIQVRLAGEVHERGIAGTLDARSTAHLLHETLNITMSDARGRVAAAVAGLPSETPIGAVIDPVAPDLLAAIEAGELSPGHAKVITHCLSKIPPAVDSDVVEACRRTLIEQAGLRREQALGEILHRHLTSGSGPRDGGVRPQVVVTVGAADLFGSAQSAEAAPAGDGQPPDGWMAPGRRPPPDGWRAPGSWVAPGSRPPPDGWSMRTRAGDERRSSWRGSAWSDYDGTQSVAFAKLLACDAAIIPQVLGGDSVVLDQGRGARLFTAEQRRAITTRDKGCAFPGCDIPAAWCESHVRREALIDRVEVRDLHRCPVAAG